jgi:predicted ferric reductase
MKKRNKNLVWAALGIAILGVVSLWAISSFNGLVSSPAGALTALGQLAGLLAALCALIQFMLMGRIGWIEGPFGLDRLAIFHRLNGYATISLILIHPLLLSFGYGLNAGVSALSQYITFITTFPDVSKALIAQILFISVVATSIYIVRKKLAFEQWYWVHLLVYAAIFLAFFHQIAVGSTFTASPLYKSIWIGLYGFVALNVLYYRFLKLGIGFGKHQFRVAKVQRESSSATSIYIALKNQDKWKFKAGQFVMVRFLTKELWLQEHPFSISMMPKEGRIRLTIKNIGDFTAAVQNLKEGASVFVSGPFGHFTSDLSTNSKRLYIAGGVGVTPIRALIEEGRGHEDSQLLYANKTSADTILEHELETLLGAANIKLMYSDDPKANGEHGRIDLNAISRLVPDYMNRDIFLCGPAGMMNAIVEGLIKANYPSERIFYERFALHP